MPFSTSSKLGATSVVFSVTAVILLLVSLLGLNAVGNHNWARCETETSSPDNGFGEFTITHVGLTSVRQVYTKYTGEQTEWTWQICDDDVKWGPVRGAALCIAGNTMLGIDTTAVSIAGIALILSVLAMLKQWRSSIVQGIAAAQMVAGVLIASGAGFYAHMMTVAGSGAVYYLSDCAVRSPVMGVCFSAAILLIAAGATLLMSLSADGSAIAQANGAPMAIGSSSFQAKLLAVPKLGASSFLFSLVGVILQIVALAGFDMFGLQNWGRCDWTSPLQDGQVSAFFGLRWMKVETTSYSGIRQSQGGICDQPTQQTDIGHAPCQFGTVMFGLAIGAVVLGGLGFLLTVPAIFGRFKRSMVCAIASGQIVASFVLGGGLVWYGIQLSMTGDDQTANCYATQSILGICGTASSLLFFAGLCLFGMKIVPNHNEDQLNVSGGPDANRVGLSKVADGHTVKIHVEESIESKTNASRSYSPPEYHSAAESVLRIEGNAGENDQKEGAMEA
jgi:hypothetical protein